MEEKKQLSMRPYYFYLAVGIIGLGLIIFAAWWQSKGFTADYVNGYLIVLAFMLGILFGHMGIRYMRNRSKKSEEIGDIRHVLYPKDMKSMMIGYLIMGAVCILLAFTAMQVIYFYLAIGFGAFAASASISFYFWAMDWKKEVEEKEKGGNTAG